MVTLTISSASKPPAFARGFPLSVQVPYDATVADVKASIAAKYPKVSRISGSSPRCTIEVILGAPDAYLHTSLMLFVRETF